MIILILQMRKLRSRGTKCHIHVTQLEVVGSVFKPRQVFHLMLLFEADSTSFFFLATLHSLDYSPTRN